MSFYLLEILLYYDLDVGFLGCRNKFCILYVFILIFIFFGLFLLFGSVCSVVVCFEIFGNDVLVINCLM